MSNLKLTKRDIQLAEKLSQYGILSTRQIETMCFSGIRTTTVLRRLRRLEEDEYLRRVPETRPYIWTLGKRDMLLYEMPRYGLINRNTLSHDMAINDVRWVLEKAGLGAAWKPGHILRKQAARTYTNSRGSIDAIPDGLIGVPVQGTYRGVALEVELHAKGHYRYRKVFQSYYDKKNIWKIWYIVAHEKLGQQILKISSKVYWNKAPGFVAYSLLDELVKDPFTARAWTAQGSAMVSEIFPLVPSSKIAEPTPSIEHPAQLPAHLLSRKQSMTESLDATNSSAPKEIFESTNPPEIRAGLTYRGGLGGVWRAKSSSEESKSDAESEVPHGN